MSITRRALSTLALAASISAAFPALAADPIKIGVNGPFTGGSSSMGVSMRDGVRLAADEINKAGGVLGRQLLLVERDDEAKNERGVQIAQELINKEKVAAAVGFINTGVALAAQRFYQEAKIPVMNNVATGSIITKQFADKPENYIFRNAAHDSIQAPMIVEEAITRRGFKKVAILADSTNCSWRPSTPPDLLISSTARRTPSRMLTPIDDEPPVNGPCTPILIGSAAMAALRLTASATALRALTAKCMSVS